MKAVIFDLDGTLLDTLDDLADSVNAVLAQGGFPTHPTVAYQTFVGNGAEMLIRRALPEGADEETVRRTLKNFQAYYGEHCLDKTCPYEGVAEALKSLKQAGLRLAVLSNKPHPFTCELAERFFPHVFDAVAGNRAEFPRKPEPHAPCWLAGRLGVLPEECFFVGDSGVDMQTGVKAGMHPCGVSWGFRGEEELLQNGAKLVLHAPAELEKLAKI